MCVSRCERARTASISIPAATPEANAGSEAMPSCTLPIIVNCTLPVPSCQVQNDEVSVTRIERSAEGDARGTGRPTVGASQGCAKENTPPSRT